jgi:membrane protease YdiL (CAAX protease family)
VRGSVRDRAGSVSWVGLVWWLVRLAAGFVLIRFGSRWALEHVSPHGAFDAVARLFGDADERLSSQILSDALVYSATAVLLYWAFVRVTERRRVGELGGGLHGLAQFWLGWALGCGLCGLIVAVLGLAGAYDPLGWQSWTVLRWSALTAAAGFVQEPLYRGVVLRVSEERLGSWLALLVSSLAFGAAHLNNPGARAVDSISIFIFGLLFGAAYLLTRRLWLPIGLHAAWNLAQGGIFGISVSGTGYPGILDGRMDGPSWLTGGAFGAESSLVSWVVIGGAAGVMLWLAWRRGSLVGPRLRGWRWDDRGRPEAQPAEPEATRPVRRTL